MSLVYKVKHVLWLTLQRRDWLLESEITLRLRVKVADSELKFNSELVSVARKAVSANSELNCELNRDEINSGIEIS